jgi:hypothetical protein
MRIVLYTEGVKNALNTRTEVYPWLHCAMQSMRFTDGRDDDLISEPLGTAQVKHNPLYYVIYVWDTRKVLEYGVVQPCKGVYSGC